MAATISFVGVEPGSEASGYAAQNWSNAGVSKAYDLDGNIYGSSGYYQIRPISYPPSSTIYAGAAAGNNLGITAAPNPTLYSAPVFLSSITGEAGDYVNFNGYSIFRGPDGSTLYTQGGLSVPVNQGTHNTPSGSNNGYFGNAFSFTMASNMGASFRIGVAVDMVADGTYAPNYVSLYTGSSGTVFSSSLTRNGTPDMTVFDVTASAGESVYAALWQLSGTQSAAALGLITFDVSSYNLDIASGTQTNSSVLGGAQAELRKTGAGTTLLTGVSTYQGATTISNGVLELGGAGQLASGNYSNAVSLVSNSSSLRISTSNNQTLSGAISGTGSLVKSAGGTLTLSGSNSHSGGTTISGGRLIAASTNALGDAGAAVTVSGGAYLQLGTNITRTGAMTFDGGYLQTSNGSSMTKNGGSYVLTNAAEIDAGLGGTAGLTRGGAGVSVLWKSNSYTGATVVTGGALRLDGTGNLSSSTTLQVDSGATFSMTGIFLTSNDVTVAGLTGAGKVYGGAGNFTVNKASGTDSFTGTIEGGIGVTKSGGGQLWLGGSNSYTGATTIGGGVLNLAHANGLGGTAGGTTVGSGSVLRLQGTNGGGSGITVGNESLSISGLGVSGTGGALRSVSGTNTWQGAITLAADARIGSASNSVLTLDVASGNAITSANFNLSTEGAGHIQVNDAINLGTGGLTKLGSGSLILAASNSYSGATDIQAGRLTVSGNGRLGSGAISIADANGGSLELAVTGTNVMGNAISGNGAILSSSGVTQLNGAVTSTGGLTVNGSTVRIGSSGSINSSTSTVNSGGILDVAGTAGNVQLNSGGTLKGSGTVSALTIASGGTLAPGNSPGTLTASSATWNGGGTYAWEINNFLGSAGTNWDFLNITGGLTINASSGNKFIIDVISLLASDNTGGNASNFNSLSNYSFAIATAAGGITGFDASYFDIQTTKFSNTISPTGGWYLTQTGTSINLNYAAAIPEPSVGGLLAVGLGLITAMRRKRSSTA